MILHTDAGLGTLSSHHFVRRCCTGDGRLISPQHCVSDKRCRARQVDQAVVEVAARVRLHSNRSQAGEWARVGSDDSEVRGISEERIREVRVGEAASRAELLNACQAPCC